MWAYNFQLRCGAIGYEGLIFDAERVWDMEGEWSEILNRPEALTHRRSFGALPPFRSSAPPSRCPNLASYAVHMRLKRLRPKRARRPPRAARVAAERGGGGRGAPALRRHGGRARGDARLTLTLTLTPTLTPTLTRTQKPLP